MGNWPIKRYSWDGSTYIQHGSDIDGKASYDGSGWSVSLSNDGSVLAIGAYGNDGNGGYYGNIDYPGHVHVYRLDVCGSDINGKGVWDTSEWSVSLSNDGSVLAIGAPWNAGNGYGPGHVPVYNV